VKPKRQMSLNDLELVVDNFAGGGGASTGIALAISRSVDIAINHDPAAIAMHKTNHPETKHYQESVWDVDPIRVTQGRPVALAWFSPDCTHHSKARGSKPVKKSIRGLAWIVLKWAVLVGFRVGMLENVEEFRDWGPLDESDLPIKERKGETFAAFVACLTTGLAPDHPAWPEIRETIGDDFPYHRLEQGLAYQVEWRELRACDYGAPTIRKRLFVVMRRDGRPIVWPEPTHGDPNSLAVRSGKIEPWRTAAEIIDWSLPCPSIFDRTRPLKDATLRRIARGIMKFVVNNASPFIIPVTHQGSDRVASLDAPLPTVTAAHRGELALVMPTLTASFVDRQFGKSIGSPADEPLGTVTAGGSGKSNLVAAFLAQYHSEMVDHDARGQTLDRPILTLDTSNRYALVTGNLIKLYGTTTGQRVDEPLHTVTAGGLKFGEVRAFLTKYYGACDDGQELNEPLHTVTAKARFGLVTVLGQDYQIVDIGMRMLQPRELFNAQGFPPDYKIDQDRDGNRYTKADQVARCGNAVPPVFSEALVRANLPEMCGLPAQLPA
jgi:DNA (cytosine-5)-methyltransferase 1